VEQHTFGWRQLFGAVRLRDFADMVAGELKLIGTSARLAAEAFPKLPFGPLAFLGAMLLVLLRLVLLLLVAVFFGTSILLISAVRNAVRLVRGQP